MSDTVRIVIYNAKVDNNDDGYDVTLVDAVARAAATRAEIALTNALVKDARLLEAARGWCSRGSRRMGTSARTS